MITSYAARPVSVSDEIVALAFDDHSIPMWDNMFLTLEQGRKWSGNPVLCSGGKAAADEAGCRFPGAVVSVGSRLRMYYIAQPAAGAKSGGFLACAESDDGVHWAKPKLGLVDWNGDCDNNLCMLEPVTTGASERISGVSVLYDPDDMDPERRFKACVVQLESAESLRSAGIDRRQQVPVIRAVISADGYRWHFLHSKNPLLPERFETAGLYKFGGQYGFEGQQMSPWVHLPGGSSCGGVITAHKSADFAHWSSGKALAFARPGYMSKPGGEGEQVCMGAGVWNRGNVLVGLYGMWNGTSDCDQPNRHSPVDLGVIVSNDGIHFREPVRDFRIVQAGLSGSWDELAIAPGQAFMNMGDWTHFWYSHLDMDARGTLDEIGLCTWRRDGLGYLSRRHAYLDGHFVTCEFGADEPIQVFVNAAELSEAMPLKVEILDPQGIPLTGYAGDACVPMAISGVSQLVRWADTDTLTIPGGSRFRIKGTMTGEAGDQRVYAVYLRSIASGELQE